MKIDVEASVQEGSLDGSYARVKAVDHEYGTDMILDITRDNVPGIIADNLEKCGGMVYLVTGTQSRADGHFRGKIHMFSLNRVATKLWPGYNIGIEDAFQAGPNHMPYHRVWLKPSKPITLFNR